MWVSQKELKYIVIILSVGKPFGNTFFYLFIFQILSMKMYNYMLEIFGKLGNNIS